MYSKSLGARKSFGCEHRPGYRSELDCFQREILSVPNRTLKTQQLSLRARPGCALRASLRARPSGRCDAVAVHLEFERAARDLELLGGSRLVPIGAREGFEDQHLLEVSQRGIEAELSASH